MDRSRVKRWLWIVMIAGISLPIFAEDAGKSVYSESFKKGPTKITEQTLDVVLTQARSAQEFKVMDAAGTPRYTLRFVPDVRPGETRILGWFVRLADLHHKIYDNLLPVSQDSAQDTQQNWWLDGRLYAKIPLQTTRIFRIEQFYCVVKVKELKRLVPEQPYLSELDLTTQFTNTKP